MTINAYAATEVGGKLQPFEYDPGSLGSEQLSSPRFEKRGFQTLLRNAL
ncbi:hypothetical protein [Dactylococcopsis salina]|uniref:Uncharacterized protein n=1 Tax=Dactylococcopsis salina (strain PCC 8305) TaxID=13035 RepID=K9YX71_DACS8|nr:hypothetical protein [Dactylococcopsis salina]AFZ51531.1 hypothetical protein Dacsa_2990 [Dactylococcopsis salina PCC 8305]